jgi:hypothetical protein
LSFVLHPHPYIAFEFQLWCIYYLVARAPAFFKHSAQTANQQAQQQLMAPRVHSSPESLSSSSSSRPPPCAGEQGKVFTVWMKSLVLNGHGCTVYDSGGGIVYRVDNYGSRCGGGSACLMDLDGTAVLSVVKKVTH